MKKFLLLAVATLAMSLSSFGATLVVSCGGATYDRSGAVIGGSNIAVCPNFNVADGFQLTNVTLQYFVDYSFAGPGTPPNSISVNFDVTPNATFTNDPITVSQSGNGSSPGAVSASGVSNLVLVGPATYTGATVNLSIQSISLATIGTVSGNASVFATYTYDAVPPPSTGVPEPTTVGLIGAGLVGLAAAARRRR